jgi:hypothetical protein
LETIWTGRSGNDFKYSKQITLEEQDLQEEMSYNVINSEKLRK